MCGIIAYLGKDNAVFNVIMGMEKLEYRGYDSAGLCYIDNDILHLVKQPGCVADLMNKIDLNANSEICIGHTRWATHGAASKRNAHPHVTRDLRLAIVHNGIIENSESLKAELIDKGYEFLSDTDTEVLLYLIYDYFMDNAIGLYDAVKVAMKRIVGAYAFIVIDKRNNNELICAKNGSPMVVGIQENGLDYYVASDAYAFPKEIKKIIYVKDGNVIRINNKIESFDVNTDKIISLDIEKIARDWYDADKRGFSYFMEKEIYEQPLAISNAMAGRINGYRIVYGGLEEISQKIKESEHITIIACGTSYHSGLLGKYYIEHFTNKKVSVEYASEFRYRENKNIRKNDIVIGISQSGETADVIEALKEVKKSGCVVLGVCNSVDSSISRLTDAGIYIKAGIEIGVASTKAFTNQTICLMMMALWIQQQEGGDIYTEQRKAILSDVGKISDSIIKILHIDKQIHNIAKKYKNYDRFLFVGRQYNYPVALEGALKMKELCYNHAEGYAAAELKHGPIALVDDKTATIVINNDIKQQIKMDSTIREIKSRGGKIINIDYARKTSDLMLISPSELIDENIVVPNIISSLSPILSVVPLQLFAFYSAIEREKNVDRPRNLAKSVTVE